MSKAILPFIQALPNRDFQAKPRDNSGSDKSNFTDMLNNAQIKPEKSYESSDNHIKQNRNIDKQDNKIYVSDNSMDKNKMLTGQAAGIDSKEGVSAREFLEKIGLDESDIKDILQANGLGENSSLLDLLKAINFEMTDFAEFLETSFDDFLRQLDGLGENKIEEISLRMSGKLENLNQIGVDGESKPVLSMMNVFNEIDLDIDGNRVVEKNDLSLKEFFQKVGLNEKEAQNLIKELNTGQQLSNKPVLNILDSKAEDLLKKMGLDTEKVSSILKESFESKGTRDNIKAFLLNGNVNQLKNLSLLNANKLNVAGEINLNGQSQTNNGKVVSDLFAGRLRSEMSLPFNSAMSDNLSVTSQNSMSGNGVNSVVETLGTTSPLLKNSGEVLSDLKLNEPMPKAFFERTVLDQIVSKVSVRMSGGREEMRIHLEPPSLGSLQLKVAVEGRTVNATIIADNSITRDIVQSNINQLKESLAEQGMKLDSLSVLVGEGQRDRNMDEHRTLLSQQETETMTNENESYENTLGQSPENILRQGLANSLGGVNLFV